MEFIKRGATVTGFEINPKYLAQANFVKEYFDLESLTVVSQDIYNIHSFGFFDIVLCLGVLYHVRYPQLLIDLCQSVCNEVLVLSTQVYDSQDFAMINRCSVVDAKNQQNANWLGWLISEKAVFKMLSSAGFKNIEKIFNRKDGNYNPAIGAHNDLYICAHSSGSHHLPGFIKILKK